MVAEHPRPLAQPILLQRNLQMIIFVIMGSNLKIDQQATTIFIQLRQLNLLGAS